MNYRSINEKRLAIKPNMLIVGIDIAKRTHVARARLPDHSFTNPFYFTNDIHGFTRLLAQTSKWREQLKLDDLIVGMEPTGHYFKPLARWLTNHGIKVVLVNPRDVKRDKTRFNNNPTKGDAKDAILIADLVADGAYFKLRLAEGKLATLQRLVRHRRQLIKDLTVASNRLQADLDERFPEFATVYSDFQSATVRYLIEHYPSPPQLLVPSVAQLERKIKRHCANAVITGKLALLRSKAAETVGSEVGWDEDSEIIIQTKLKIIKLLKDQLGPVEAAIERITSTFEDTKYMVSPRGIGLLSAGIITAETGGLRNYRSGDAVVKMAGLDLYEQSTGQTKGQRHISHYGRSLLRTTLYFDAVVQTRKGMPFHRMYCDLVKHGKHKVEALIAVACAILRLLYALVRDRRYYTDEPPESQLVPAT